MSQLQSLPIEKLPHTPHDIFLSHSGAQKGFAKYLYEELRGSYSTFLDITHHSLPLGEKFANLILHAAKNCKLAVVVVSEEFVRSKWPMIELAAFVAAKVTILPLFFKLSPSDLKHEDNLQRWHEAWNSYADQDPKHRIDVAKWDSALQELSSRNGLIFDQTSEEDQQAFLHTIVRGIPQIVPPTIKFDTRHIHGEDRLCKVILDQFERMESRAQESVEDRGSGFKPACILGVYGMPGSGKSTLCKCLNNRFDSMYDLGKVSYLEVPSNPSPADLIHLYKKLLRLTDFRERIPLGEVELEQVKHLLHIHELPSRRVFLVIDNVSEGSWEEVQRLCELGFGPGSKVILVARSLDVLHPILKTIENYGSQCICDCIPMPTINEEEALQIILQRTRALDGRTLQENVTAEQKESIILGIVRMCRFTSLHAGFLYLPLVMEAMGSILIKYEENLEGWRSDMERFWTRVETYKEDAVEMLLGESFKTLPSESHRLLFLDVALFILPLRIQKDDAYICLRSMHDGVDQWRMEMMMTDLERHCFLTVSKGGFINVHDVYIQFAKSISKGPHAFSNFLWIQERHAEKSGLRRLTPKPESEYHGLQAVRAMIQEVGPSCERIDLEGFSRLKALCVRNSKGLKVLGLAGSTSQLVSLDITECPNFQRLKCTRDGHDYASLLKMKRLNVDLAGWGMWGSKEMTLFRRPNLVGGRIIKWVLMQRVFAPMMLRWGWNSCNVRNMVRQMRNLQALHIHNTGIPRLEDMSSYWPQLQVLTVMEHNLEALELGKLPDLRLFLFCDYGSDGFLWGQYEDYIRDTRYCSGESCSPYKTSDSWRRKQGNPRFMLSGKDLLVGCPRLEGVFMESAFFEEGEPSTLPGPNLSSLTLRCFDSMAQLPDLSSSAHTLKQLNIQCCEQLTRVTLMVGFENLVTLVLAYCPKLVEVTGLEGLPNLQALHVSNCYNLQSLNGFDNARMLRTLYFSSCHLLREISCLNGLANLESLGVVYCHPNLQTFMATAGLHGLIKLKTLNVQLIGQSGTFSLGELKHLETLEVNDRSVGGSALEGWEKLVNLKRLTLWGQNLSTLPLEEKAMTAKLTSLYLWDLNAVTRLDGIEHHVTLEQLWLIELQNLRSAQGLEFLINLQDLAVYRCPMLESLPSLRTLRNVHSLEISGCAKLKAIEGCDQMKKLSSVYFARCTSLAAFPLANLDVPVTCLRFEGCKFARDVEMMLACLGDKEAPYALRKAWLHAWVWLYEQARTGKKWTSLLLQEHPFVTNKEFEHIVQNINTFLKTYRESER